MIASTNQILRWKTNLLGRLAIRCCGREVSGKILCWNEKVQRSKETVRGRETGTGRDKEGPSVRVVVVSLGLYRRVFRAF